MAGFTINKLLKYVERNCGSVAGDPWQTPRGTIAFQVLLPYRNENCEREFEIAMGDALRKCEAKFVSKIDRMAVDREKSLGLSIGAWGGINRIRHIGGWYSKNIKHHVQFYMYIPREMYVVEYLEDGKMPFEAYNVQCRFCNGDSVQATDVVSPISARKNARKIFSYEEYISIEKCHRDVLSGYSMFAETEYIRYYGWSHFGMVMPK